MDSAKTTRFVQPEAMLFDLDGTLFRTESVLISAYHKVFARLREEGLYPGPTPPEERILGSLGMLLEEIWRRVMPDGSPEAHSRANELLLIYQVQELGAGGGEMYPGVESTLRELHRRGIRLYVASNGLEKYVKGVIRHKGLAPLFDGLYSAGEYGTRSKADLVRRLLDEQGIASAWMVGDRSSDVEAGRKNGLVTVGCDYAGFRKEGELDGCDIRITAFPQILQYLAQA